ncbi:DUF1800 domain-containing protein [Rhodoferax mekongensis]|uniref:DUF1800 domain-containing protein n=1 Tax=Rhodoferax mekongensis TaxID=3068341 RepID=UPI0028BF15BF|nr:DUF1800 domain-containing protein [Rhodoferax sp. TBRC 17199]MDT7513509.1 DUF1800 domain-containing protein [Rhodoferax sp. TBRC 17199]
MLLGLQRHHGGSYYRRKLCTDSVRWRGWWRLWWGGATTYTPLTSGRVVALNAFNSTALSSINDAQAARFLQQAGLASTDEEIASVRSLGYAGWIQAEIAKSSGISGWDWLDSQGYGNVYNTANYYDNDYPGSYMIWSQLMTAPNPMRKRAALALSEILVVSLAGLDFSWRSHGIARYWDILVTHAFGNFRDLLEAITLNPAMGYYLNTKGNLKENAATGRQPDENYAREVMQLFTVGLNLLNSDGTLKLDTNGKAQETYTASDVSNLARVFTGYDVDRSQNVDTVIAQTGGGTRTIPNTSYVRLPMKLTASNHSTLEVQFLGTTIPAGTPGAAALKIALDRLFNHPNTAPFICKQLIQRLVTSNPSAAYVGRVAAVFADNGSGVRGDLAFVFAAILLDDEARNSAGLTAPEFGKLREPMLRLVQWVRTFKVTSTSGAWKIGDLSSPGSALGQSPLRSPSVFNFFRPGYVPPSTVAPPATGLSAGKVAPEFQIVNETSVGGYLNYMMTVIDSGLNSGDIKASYATELTLVLNPSALVQRLNLLLAGGQLSGATVTVIVNALLGVTVTASSSATVKRNRVCAAVLMVMASVEYLVQK